MAWTGATVAGGAASAAAGGGIPWSLILPTLTSIFSGLFGKDKSDELIQQLIKTIQPNLEYYTGEVKGISPTVKEGLLSRYGALKDWGMPGGQEFKWSEDATGAIKGLKERMNYLLEYPTGITPEEKQAIINYSARGIKAGQAPALESTRAALSRAGLLGTGAEFEEMGNIKRGTSQALADLQNKVTIQDIQDRYNKLMGTTEATQSLAGTILGTEVTPEQLNVARRGEGRGGLQDIITYLQTMMGGQQGSMDQYLRAIMNQLQLTQGGGMEYLPMFAYLAGKSMEKPKTTTGSYIPAEFG
jgi:hypothetical protein